MGGCPRSVLDRGGALSAASSSIVGSASTQTRTNMIKRRMRSPPVLQMARNRALQSEYRRLGFEYPNDNDELPSDTRKHRQREAAWQRQMDRVTAHSWRIANTSRFEPYDETEPVEGDRG